MTALIIFAMGGLCAQSLNDFDRTKDWLSLFFAAAYAALALIHGLTL